MKKSKILANAIAMILATASMGAGAQTCIPIGNLPSAYTTLASTNGFTWDGHSSWAGEGWGNVEPISPISFNLTSPTVINVKMSSTLLKASPPINAAFTLWSALPTVDFNKNSMCNDWGHGFNYAFSQVSTDSINNNNIQQGLLNPIPWLTDPAAGGITGFVGYANSGPTGWTNGAGLTVGNGTELNGVNLVDTVSVGDHNAELRTKILPAGRYILVAGGSNACGSFLSNNLSTCPPLWDNTYSLTIERVGTFGPHITEDNNADARSDILWRNSSTGENYLYFMNGEKISGGLSGYIVSGAGVNTVADPNWQIKGRGDYNGDGKADILWRNSSTGENHLYLMNGASISGVAAPTVADPAWKIVGNGDFNKDGKSDILWRNSSTGDNYLFLMDGGTATSTKFINTIADQAWQVKGTGDYNGDGYADILWRNSSTGANYLYLMNGATVTSTNYIDTVADLTWDIKGTGDFNADGKSDILWRNSATGVNYLYLMNGATYTANYINTDANQANQIKGTGDYDGDGKADIFWRNSSSGVSTVSLMNGATINDSSFVSTGVNPAAPTIDTTSLNWQIAYVP